MVYFWSALAATYAIKKKDRLRAAEAALLEWTMGAGNEGVVVQPVDTVLAKSGHTIHSLQVSNKKGVDEENRRLGADEKDDIPLVLLHGYMNGAAYFYRNFAGLSQYFSQIHSLDLLGWGLSSRPDYQKHIRDELAKNATSIEEESENPTRKTKLSTAQDFFVESLEEWRQAQQIDRMILAGHSMGGYLSVAYAEKYPQHVERLVLISPVGVPEQTADMLERRKERAQKAGLKFRCLMGIYEFFFHRYYTVGDVIRQLPERWGRNKIHQYITRRLPTICDPTEQSLLCNYVYENVTQRPGSGEYCVSDILTSNAFARMPLHDRIPKLQVSHCSFLYGDCDWMDEKAALAVQAKIDQQARKSSSPAIQVFRVRMAGHLLQLENPVEFNNAVALAAGKTVPNGAKVPKLLRVGDDEHNSDDNEFAFDDDDENEAAPATDVETTSLVTKKSE